MRVDYFHGGGPTTGETFALDRIVNDGAWAGSRTQLVDGTNLGKYLFEVRDAVIVRRALLARLRVDLRRVGDDAGGEDRRRGRSTNRCGCPGPRRPVTVTLKKRQTDNSFTRRVDDGRRSGVAVRQSRGAAGAPGQVWTVIENGPASQKVDLLIISEGYTRGAAAEVPRATSSGCSASLFAQEPFKSRRSGLQRPRAGPAVAGQRDQPAERRRVPADAAVGAEYNVFDSERYVLTLDNRALRDAASAAPYEFIEILVNEQTYGGGGIFNDQATAAVDSAFCRLRVRARVRPSLRRRSPTSTTRRTWRTRRAPPTAGAVGAERDGAAGSGGAEVAATWSRRARRCRRRGKRTTFEQQSRAIQERRRAIRARNAPEAEMDALFSEERDCARKLAWAA